MGGIRIPIGRAALFVALFALCLAATYPLSSAIALLALDARGLTARAATGAALSGQLLDARFGSLGLGSPAARISLPALLVGEAKLILAAPEGAPFSGKLTGSRNGVGLQDIEANLPLADLGIPFAGTVSMRDVDIRFENGQCVEAEGDISTDALGASAAEYGMPAVTMAGSPRCEGEQVVLPLSGSSGGMRGDLEIYLGLSGAATGALTISGMDPAMTTMLQGYGFRADGEAIRLAF